MWSVIQGSLGDQRFRVAMQIAGLEGLQFDGKAFTVRGTAVSQEEVAQIWANLAVLPGNAREDGFCKALGGPDLCLKRYDQLLEAWESRRSDPAFKDVLLDARDLKFEKGCPRVDQSVCNPVLAFYRQGQLLPPKALAELWEKLFGLAAAPTVAAVPKDDAAAPRRDATAARETLKTRVEGLLSRFRGMFGGSEPSELESAAVVALPGSGGGPSAGARPGGSTPPAAGAQGSPAAAPQTLDDARDARKSAARAIADAPLPLPIPGFGALRALARAEAERIERAERLEQRARRSADSGLEGLEPARELDRILALPESERESALKAWQAARDEELTASVGPAFERSLALRKRYHELKAAGASEAELEEALRAHDAHYDAEVAPRAQRLSARQRDLQAGLVADGTPFDPSEYGLPAGTSVVKDTVDGRPGMRIEAAEGAGWEFVSLDGGLRLKGRPAAPGRPEAFDILAPGSKIAKRAHLDENGGIVVDHFVIEGTEQKLVIDDKGRVSAEIGWDEKGAPKLAAFVDAGLLTADQAAIIAGEFPARFAEGGSTRYTVPPQLTMTEKGPVLKFKTYVERESDGAHSREVSFSYEPELGGWVRYAKDRSAGPQGTHERDELSLFRGWKDGHFSERKDYVTADRSAFDVHGADWTKSVKKTSTIEQSWKGGGWHIESRKLAPQEELSLIGTSLSIVGSLPVVSEVRTAIGAVGGAGWAFAAGVSGLAAQGIASAQKDLGFDNTNFAVYGAVTPQQSLLGKLGNAERLAIQDLRRSMGPEGFANYRATLVQEYRQALLDDPNVPAEQKLTLGSGGEFKPSDEQLGGYLIYGSKYGWSNAGAEFLRRAKEAGPSWTGAGWAGVALVNQAGVMVTQSAGFAGLGSGLNALSRIGKGGAAGAGQAAAAGNAAATGAQVSRGAQLAGGAGRVLKAGTGVADGLDDAMDYAEMANGVISGGAGADVLLQYLSMKLSGKISGAGGDKKGAMRAHVEGSPEFQAAARRAAESGAREVVAAVDPKSGQIRFGADAAELALGGEPPLRLRVETGPDGRARLAGALDKKAGSAAPKAKAGDAGDAEPIALDVSEGTAALLKASAPKGLVARVGGWVGSLFSRRASEPAPVPSPVPDAAKPAAEAAALAERAKRADAELLRYVDEKLAAPELRGARSLEQTAEFIRLQALKKAFESGKLPSYFAARGAMSEHAGADARADGIRYNPVQADKIPPDLLALLTYHEATHVLQLYGAGDAAATMPESFAKSGHMPLLTEHTAHEAHYEAMGPYLKKHGIELEGLDIRDPAQRRRVEDALKRAYADPAEAEAAVNGVESLLRMKATLDAGGNTWDFLTQPDSRSYYDRLKLDPTKPVKEQKLAKMRELRATLQAKIDGLGLESARAKHAELAKPGVDMTPEQSALLDNFLQRRGYERALTGLDEAIARAESRPEEFHRGEHERRESEKIEQKKKRDERLAKKRGEAEPIAADLSAGGADAPWDGDKAELVGHIAKQVYRVRAGGHDAIAKLNPSPRELEALRRASAFALPAAIDNVSIPGLLGEGPAALPKSLRGKVEPGQTPIVMAEARGENLKDYLDRDGAPSISAGDWAKFRAAVDALGAAGIEHLDLKNPENIYVHFKDGRAHFEIIDWGGPTIPKMIEAQRKKAAAAGLSVDALAVQGLEARLAESGRLATERDAGH